LTATKATDNKTSLLQYLVKHVAYNSPETNKFIEELKEVKDASTRMIRFVCLFVCCGRFWDEICLSVETVESSYVQSEVKRFQVQMNRIKTEISLCSKSREAKEQEEADDITRSRSPTVDTSANNHRFTYDPRLDHFVMVMEISFPLLLEKKKKIVVIVVVDFP